MNILGKAEQLLGRCREHGIATQKNIVDFLRLDSCACYDRSDFDVNIEMALLVLLRRW